MQGHQPDDEYVTSDEVDREEVALAVSFPPSPPWGEKAKLLVVAMAFVVALIGLYLVRNVLAIAALSALIAFLIAPIIRIAHEKLRIPRGIALIIAYLLVFFGTLAFGYLLARSIVNSIVEIDPIGRIDEARMWLLESVDANERLVILGLTVDMSGVIEALRVSANDGGGTGGFILDAEEIIRNLGAGIEGVRTVLGIITAIITTGILTALIAIYLNADSRRMHAGLVDSLPPGYERDGLLMMQAIKRVWRGYLYGQLVNSLITGTLVGLALWFVGLPGAFLMGTIMAVLNMIPTFGPILAAIPGILAALISGSTKWPDLESFWFALIVAGIYLVVVQAQANVIAPKVMGTAVRLRPAIVLLGLLVGFQIGGLLGSLLAVPIIASIRDVAVYVWAKLIDKDPFEDEALAPALPEP
jgi:predicted PurR-regulated permease PerM